MKVSFTKFLLGTVIPSLIVIIIVNFIIPPKQVTNTETIIENAKRSGNYAAAEKEYGNLIKKDFYNIKLHREYISTHLSIPKKNDDNEIRNDNDILKKYKRYSQSADTNISNIGYYGLGLFYGYEENFKLALEYFEKIKNKNLIYLNNSLGFIYYQLDNYSLAKKYFYKEIFIKGNIEGAYSNLTDMLFFTREYNELKYLISKPGVKSFVSPKIIRFFEIKEINIIDYITDITTFSGFNLSGFIGAIFILLIWFFYLRNIDIFEPEPWKFSLAALLGGMLFSFFTIPLYDIAEFFFNIKFSGNFYNDLFFCIFGIGFIEELVKIIPVLLLLKFSKQINESVDFIIYGSLSGLGFAFIENLLYFHEGGLINITGRGLCAVVLHMTLTSIVMYGLFFSKYKAKKNPGLFLCISFGSAALIHGLYDFFLMAKSLNGKFAFISILILVYCIISYGKAINCALNISEYLQDKSVTIIDQTKKLCYFLAGITMLQYIIIAYKFGIENANFDFVWNIAASYFILFIIILSIGRFEIHKAKWVPIFVEPVNS